MKNKLLINLLMPFATSKLEGKTFRNLLALVMVVMGMGFSWGQTNITLEGFETVASNPSFGFTISGGGYTTGSTASTSSAPLSSPLYSGGARGYGANNTTTTITSGNISTIGYSSVALSLKLGSFSLTSTGNGADNSDFVKVEVSPNGGTNYYILLWQVGSGNLTWAFGNSSTYTNTYSTSALSASGNNTVAQNLNITGLPNTTNLRVRITMFNDNAAELWAIDDVKITGTLSASAPILTTPTASSITTTTATLGATITADSGASISSRGTVWGTSATPTGNVLAEGATSVSAFTHGRTGFTANTLYTYRGYAINTNGTGYSPDGTFTTLSLAPSIGTGSGAEQTSFTANWSAPASQGAATFTYTVEADDDINFGSVNFTQSSIASATTTANVNTGLSAGITYYYRVRAVNAGGNSAWSGTSAGVATLSAPPEAPLATSASAVGATSFTANWNAVSGATNYRLDVMTTLINRPFINEFHYDNINTDSGEFVEIIVPNSYSGVNLKLLLYNGSGGAVYDTKTLSELTLGSSSANYKIYSYTYSNGIQNGSPDGFALSDDSGVIEFLSYEGTFAATNGPAIGLSSIDVGVAQTGDATNDPVGGSVQKTGSFGNYNWVVTQQNTIGVINTGQTINDTYVAGFENLNVGNVITYNVSGLNQNTTYFYRIRSVIGAGTSLSSNVITVQTPIVSTTWNGTAWSNGSPSNTVDAIIDGNLVTSSDLACKDLTVNSGKTLTIAAGNKLTVSGNLINNGTIVFKSNATATAMFGVFNGTQSGTGVVTTERYIPAKRAFRFLSPSVNTSTSIKLNWQENAGTTAGLGTHITGLDGATNGFDATATNNPSLYTFDNSTGAWVAVTSTLTNFTAGTPYRLMVRGDRLINLSTNTPTATETVLRATGTLKTGNFSPSLNQTAEGFSFVGNPYQATLDIKAVLNAATNMNTGVVYYWDPTLNARGGYVTRDLLGSNNNVTSNFTEFLQPGQAVFVKKSNTLSNATMTFTESNKAVANASAGVFRNINTSDYGLLRVNLQANVNNQWQTIEGTLALFNSGFNTAVTDEDATKMANLDEEVSFVQNNTSLAIACQPNPTATTELPIRLTNTRYTNYQWQFELTNYSGPTPFLVDTQNNSITQITNTTVVPFTVDTNANRFKIVFQNAVLSTDTFATQVGLYPNPSKGNGFYLQLTATTQATVRLYNTLGQEIAISHNEGHYQAKQSLAAGVYHIMVTQGEKTSKLKWIVE